ncbi:MAG TPA: GNAT family N-acetyltransferase [Candidatus Polarisedimenticolia bacterium]|nr:GNAT family N-acetyltransferase [Candidatus Polarisedimenticolia bacterium]
MSRLAGPRSRGITDLMVSILRLLRRVQNRIVTIDVYAIWASPIGVPETADDHQRLPAPDSAVTLERSSPVRRADPFYFAYCLRGRPICTINVRSADAYRRATLDLQPSEAKLIDVVTAPEERGKGFAPRLIREASAFMHSLGYERIYARIWHSNHASQRAFVKAGWKRMGTVLFVRGGSGTLVPRARRMLRISFFNSEAGRLRSRVQITTRPTRSLY